MLWDVQKKKLIAKINQAHKGAIYTLDFSRNKKFIASGGLDKIIKIWSVDQTTQGKGWPPGFFEETFGSFKDDPLVIDSEGIFED